MNNRQSGLGTIMVTPAAQVSMQEQGIEAEYLLQQHFNDYYHDFNSQLPAADEFVLSRLISAQKIPAGELWVITEFDSHTTIITHPDEPYS